MEMTRLGKEERIREGEREETMKQRNWNDRREREKDNGKEMKREKRRVKRKT